MALVSAWNRTIVSRAPRPRIASNRFRSRARNEDDEEEEPMVGSEAWRNRPATVRLPVGLHTPARTFAAAAVLKLILLMSSNSAYASFMRHIGFPNAAGPMAVLRAVPVWLVLAGAVALFVRAGLHENVVAVRASLITLVSFVGLLGYWEIKGPMAMRQRLITEMRSFRSSEGGRGGRRIRTPGEIIARERMERQAMQGSLQRDASSTFE